MIEKHLTTENTDDTEKAIGMLGVAAYIPEEQ
jgi:hypothetical protein